MRIIVKYGFIAVSAGWFSLTACSKLVEVEPPKVSLVSDAVFAANETAISTVTTTYGRMAESDVVNPFFVSLLSLSGMTGLSSDELTLFGGSENLFFFHSNQLSANVPIDFWTGIYPFVYRSNVAINKLQNAVTYEQNSQKSLLNENVRKQLLGEMQFFRAFCYFYLVQLYGDVPLLLTNDYTENSLAGRTNKDLVYKQIVKDLLDAQSNLNDGYVENDVVTVKSTSPRIRPNKSAASALLARVYLFTEQYQLAEQQSLSVIQRATLYSLVPLNDITKANNREAIWQLQPVFTGRNSQEAWNFVLPSSGPDPSFYPVYLNERLAGSFETNDQRKTNWINSVTVSGVTYYYPYKYKIATPGALVSEYSTIMRLAEQYLICAEARAKRGDISGAQEMLNVIRNRAGLPNTTAAIQSDLEDAILAERRAELFTEWGHRWFDLKRTGKIDAVMQIETPLKTGNAWQSYQQLYPVPNTEINLNPNLRGQQNPGY